MYTTHGHHIPGTDYGKQPYSIAACGGPLKCGPCAMETVTQLRKMKAEAPVTHSDNAKLSPEMQASLKAAIDKNYYEQESAGEVIGKAITIVRDYVNENDWDIDANQPREFEVKLVWFCKTLQNWKAMVITTLEDQMYYEVTYDGDKKQTYLDAYRKLRNVCIPD